MNLKRIVILAAEASTRPWFGIVLLLLITLFAAALRFFKLGAWSFWIDEIYTINHAMRHFSRPELLLENIPPSRNWVPVSVISTAQMLNHLALNEWSARLVSVLIGVLSVPILYFPTKRMFGDRVALIASLLLAVSPWHVFWSQNARFYTSLLLFYSLAVFALHFGLEKNKPGYIIAFGILLYLAASERLTALFIFPVVAAYIVALWVLRFERPPGLHLKILLLIGVPVLACGLIEAYSWMANGESRFFGDFGWFFQYHVDDPFRLLVFVANNFGIPLMVMAVFSGLFLINNRSRTGLLMLMSALTPLLILMLANLFIFTKDRYIFMTLYSWIILAAVGINEIMLILQGNVKWLAVGVFFVLFMHAANDLLLYYTVNQGNRLPWKSAFALVQARANEHDNVVAFWPEFSPYYLNHDIVAYTDVDPDTVLKSGKRYWFVMDSETISTNDKMKNWLEQNAVLIDVWYLRRPENNFLRVYFFDPNRTNSP